MISNEYPSAVVATRSGSFPSTAQAKRIGGAMEAICPICTSRDVDLRAHVCRACGAPRPPVGWVMPGSDELFSNRYHIVRLLGSGAFGVVVEGREKEQNARVAIKFIPRNRGASESLKKHSERVIEEVTHAKEMSRSGLLPEPYEVVSTEPAYIAMALVEQPSGRDLHHARWVSGRGFSEVEVSKMAVAFGRAMHVLATTRRVHNDIKPENCAWAWSVPSTSDHNALAAGVFVEKKQRYELTLYDTGSACNETSYEEVLLSGFRSVEIRHMGGTPEYMSSEFLSGAKIDWRSDQFAVGVILYEFATGEVPWPWTPVLSSDDDDNRRQVEVRLTRLRNSALPAPERMSKPLHKLVAKMTAYDPQERFLTPDELRRAIDDALTEVLRLDTARRAALSKIESKVPDQIVMLQAAMQAHNRRNETMLDLADELEELQAGFHKRDAEERLRRTERVQVVEREVERLASAYAPPSGAIRWHIMNAMHEGRRQLVARRSAALRFAARRRAVLAGIVTACAFVLWVFHIVNAHMFDFWLDRVGCWSGWPAPCGRVGVNYELARGTSRDMRAAVRAYRIACDRGYGDGCANWGRVAEFGLSGEHDNVTAVSAYARGCAFGPAWSCQRLGSLRATGRGSTQDIGAAVMAFRVGCAREDATACYLLGSILRDQHEQRTPSDTGEVLERFRFACKAGVLQACDDLGGLHRDGWIYGQRDFTVALHYFRFACERGNPNGCGNVGLAQVRGQGTTEDRISGVKNLRIACDEGNTWHCDRLRELGEATPIPSS